MKPRALPLPEPPKTSARYWTIGLPEKGPHLFRSPYFGVGSAILNWISGHYVDPATDTRSLQQKTADLLPLFGTVLGVCWCHREQELDTAPPADLTAEALTAYGRTVVAELEDADYTLPELFELWQYAKPEFDRRISVVAVLGAAKRDFSSPPRDGSTSSSPLSGSNTSGG
jgi:hypothetical protein